LLTHAAWLLAHPEFHCAARLWVFASLKHGAAASLRYRFVPVRHVYITRNCVKSHAVSRRLACCVAFKPYGLHNCCVMQNAALKTAAHLSRIVPRTRQALRLSLSYAFCLALRGRLCAHPSRGLRPSAHGRGRGRLCRHKTNCVAVPRGVAASAANAANPRVQHTQCAEGEAASTRSAWYAA